MYVLLNKFVYIVVLFVVAETCFFLRYVENNLYDFDLINFYKQRKKLLKYQNLGFVLLRSSIIAILSVTC